MSPSRDRHRSRHRAPERPAAAADPELAPHDPELDSYLAALAPDAVDQTGSFGTAQVFQLRLPGMRIEQLRRIAAERGVSPGALAVDWVIDRLDREDTPTGPLPVVDGAGEVVEPRLRGALRRLGRR